MKDNIHKKLIDDFFDEDNMIAGLDSKNIFPIIDSASNDLTKEFIEQPDLSLLDSGYQKEISTYIETLLPPKEQIYHGQLSLLLNDLAFAQQEENITSTYAIAEKIFVDYADKLSFENAVKILLIFSENDIFDHNYQSAMVILQSIYDIYPLFKKTERMDFDFHIAQCFFNLAIQESNNDYVYQAIKHSNRLLKYPSINKDQLNISLYIIITSFKMVELYDEAMQAIHEYFRNFPTFDFENQLFLEVLHIKGEIYAAQKKTKLAIETFKTYLKFHPDDEIVKKEIRILAEKKGE